MRLSNSILLALVLTIFCSGCEPVSSVNSTPEPATNSRDIVEEQKIEITNLKIEAEATQKQLAETNEANESLRQELTQSKEANDQMINRIEMINEKFLSAEKKLSDTTSELLDIKTAISSLLPQTEEDDNEANLPSDGNNKPTRNADEN